MVRGTWNEDHFVLNWFVVDTSGVFNLKCIFGRFGVWKASMIALQCASFQINRKTHINMQSQLFKLLEGTVWKKLEYMSGCSQPLCQYSSPSMQYSYIKIVAWNPTMVPLPEPFISFYPERPGILPGPGVNRRTHSIDTLKLDFIMAATVYTLYQ